MARWVALLAVLAANAAQAGFFTGQHLHDRLSSSVPVEKALALGFVAGVHDTVTRTTVCAPSSVTIGQLAAIVEKYLRENPEMWDMSGSLIVELALSKAYPCKDGGR